MADTPLEVLKEIRSRLDDLPEKIAARLSGRSAASPSAQLPAMTSRLPSIPAPAYKPPERPREAPTYTSPAKPEAPSRPYVEAKSVSTNQPTYRPSTRPAAPALPYAPPNVTGKLAQVPPHVRAKFGSQGGAVPRQLRGKRPSQGEQSIVYPGASPGGFGGQDGGAGGTAVGKEAVAFLRRIADAMDDMLQKMDKPAAAGQKQLPNLSRASSQSRQAQQLGPVPRLYEASSPSVRVSVMPQGARGGGAQLPRGRRT